MRPINIASFPCRNCGNPVSHTFCDLGMSPLSNSYVPYESLEKMEVFYPLHARVCSKCLLVQLPAFATPENIFGDYAYFSSFSDSWLDHCKAFCKTSAERFHLKANSKVVEIASNDGYLLQYFKAQGIPVLGIEPAGNVAKSAVERGIETRVRFFGRQLASELVAEGIQADLLIANNVFAHVPDVHDFSAGLAEVLKPNGVFSAEFPHLLNLIKDNEFDTIYHEHFSYYSLATASQILAKHGLIVFDVERIQTHGGSLRIFASLESAGKLHVSDSVNEVLSAERAAGLDRLEPHLHFNEKAKSIKRDLLEFMIGAKRSEKSIAGYGAPAKGNTLLNYCGIRNDFIDYTVDKNPLKQNRFLPGTHIPVLEPDHLRVTKPDYVLILPWNLRDEIISQVGFVREWGGQFVVPIPKLEIIA
jgi:SAM-dependent methyltransferase